MKKLILLPMAVLYSLNLLSQAPDWFQYQAVLRNRDGTLMSDRDVTIQVDLLRGDIQGPSIYLENHEMRTSEQGMVILKIGDPDFFNEIDWENGPYFLSITVDGEHLGTSQLLSVPYALYANRAGNVDDNDTDPTNELQTLSVNIPGRELSISDGNTVELPVSPWNIIEDDIYFQRNVGIGLVAQPEFPLDIRKTTYGDQEMDLVRIRNSDEAPNAYTGVALEAFGNLEERTYNRSELILTSDEYITMPSFRGMTAIRAGGSGFSVIADSTAGSIRFYTTEDQDMVSERVRITPEGNIGVGTTRPETRVHVKDGDIFVEDAGRGIILTSPGGTNFRITVDDGGIIHSTEVSVK